MLRPLRRLEDRWRRLASIAVVAVRALEMRARAALEAEAAPEIQAPPEPRAIEAAPEPTAADHLRRAYESLAQSEPGSTDAQVFSRLRLLVNRLEHGGRRPRR